MAKNWTYGSIFKFRSQFVNGYVSRTEQERRHLKSTFMTPGYLDLSFGLTYNCPVKRFPIVVNLSPLSLNATFAESDWIRRQQFDADGNEIKPAYAYGIEDPGQDLEIRGRFVDPDRLRPLLRQDELHALQDTGLGLLRLDEQPRDEEPHRRLHRVPARLRGVAGRRSERQGQAAPGDPSHGALGRIRWSSTPRSTSRRR